MKNLLDGVKAIVKKDDLILVLVKHDGTLDLPGGRVENEETMQFALRREISEETGLEVEIKNPVEQWSFYKAPDRLINGITFECSYLEGNVNLSGEHKDYFWATADDIGHLNFNHHFF